MHSHLSSVPASANERGASGASDLHSAGERLWVLGQPVDPVNMTQTISLLLRRALASENTSDKNDLGAYVCLTNVHTTMESRRLPGLRGAAEGAFLSVPDGMPLVWLLRKHGHSSTEKITGIDLIPRVASAGIESKLRHFFFGGAPGVADAAARALTQRVPGTKIVGALSPPFSSGIDWDLGELKTRLAASKPHILWVGLGAPKQEMWMAKVSEELDVPVMVGVGAAFDFLAGNKRTCPRFLSALGLEWLFRFLHEPRRLWHRYVVGNSAFAYRLMRERPYLVGRSSLRP